MTPQDAQREALVKLAASKPRKPTANAAEVWPALVRSWSFSVHASARTAKEDSMKGQSFFSKMTVVVPIVALALVIVLSWAADAQVSPPCMLSTRFQEQSV
jgi:hypothetical protein